MSGVDDHQLSYTAHTKQFYCSTCNKVVNTVLKYYGCGTEPFRFCENKVSKPIGNGSNKQGHTKKPVKQ